MIQGGILPVLIFISKKGIYNEKGRKKVLTAWRDRKKEDITHPFLNEKIKIGMIVHVQAMLFARVLRGVSGNLLSRDSGI
jgi:CRISPR/Cas system-associated endonuclease Cas1